MSVKLFDQKEVRSVWDEVQEKWYFSIVDVVEVLTESTDPSVYWRKLKQRLKAEGNETVTICHGLKMRSRDGKMRMTELPICNSFYALSSQFHHRKPKSEIF